MLLQMTRFQSKCWKMSGKSCGLTNVYKYSDAVGKMEVGTRILGTEFFLSYSKNDLNIIPRCSYQLK